MSAILVTFVLTSTVWACGWVIVTGKPVQDSAASPGRLGNAPAGTGSESAPAPHILTNVGLPADRLIIPVAGIFRFQLSDTFADARALGRRHDAIDIMAPRGTAVVAAAAGRVEKLFLSRLGGRTAYIRSRDRRTIFYYAHLDSYAAGLSEGQQVAQGQTIGAVGSTGDADPAAPHLHFAVMQTGPQARWYQPSTAIDPFPLLVAPSDHRGS